MGINAVVVVDSNPCKGCRVRLILMVVALFCLGLVFLAGLVLAVDCKRRQRIRRKQELARLPLPRPAAPLLAALRRSTVRPYSTLPQCRTCEQCGLLFMDPRAMYCAACDVPTCPVTAPPLGGSLLRGLASHPQEDSSDGDKESGDDLWSTLPRRHNRVAPFMPSRPPLVCSPTTLGGFFKQQAHQRSQPLEPHPPDKGDEHASQ